MNDSIEKQNGLRERRLQIKELERKKVVLTDAEEINAINQQIKALEAEDWLEERKNMKALIKAVDEFEIKKITVVSDGRELKGSYNSEEGFLWVNMESPYPSISAIIEFENSTEEDTERRAKELLEEIYKDYNLILTHKNEILEMLPEFLGEDYRQRGEMEGSLDWEANTEALLENKLQDIIGKRCCFCAFDVMYQNPIWKVTK